jgi:hypothetical protein
MKKIEVVKLVAFVKNFYPAQQFDEYTPDAWAMTLTDITFAEAQAAVLAIQKQQTDNPNMSRWIDLIDNKRQVKRDRSGRDKVLCAICARPRAACERIRDFEIRRGVPDPHEFMSADEAELNSSGRLRARRTSHADRDPSLVGDLLTEESQEGAES